MFVWLLLTFKIITTLSSQSQVLLSCLTMLICCLWSKVQLKQRNWKMVTKRTKDQRNTKGNWRLNINCLLSSILHFGICISCPTKFCITVILFRNRMITQKSLKKAQLFTISQKQRSSNDQNTYLRNWNFISNSMKTR